MAELITGQVIAHLGQGIAVAVAEQILLCQTLRKVAMLAVGDWVQCSRISPTQGRIEVLLPRRSVLTRPCRNGTVRPVAANIEQVNIVLAAEPKCDFLLLDQYLAVCAREQFTIKLIINKVDLPLTANVLDELSLYQQLGYETLAISVKQNVGFAELKRSLRDKTSIFVGQSGVGKSSLTNALLPDKQLKTNSLSTSSKQGRHTTTTATLYHLPEGGAIIDSPGVAIFGLADLTAAQLAAGYLEFQPWIVQCRFQDCRHAQDAGCAVRQAVEQGSIALSRYQRFLKLHEKMPR